MQLRYVAIAVAPCLCSIPAFAQQLIGSMPGAYGERFGSAVVDAGDQDGDGYSDLVVGAPGRNGGQGGIKCVSGRFLATGTGPSTLWTVDALSASLSAAFGSSIALIGNLVGDAAPDFAVGAPNYSPPASGQITGAVYLVDGSTHTLSTFINGYSNTHLGHAVVAIGDRDHDGLPDLATSALNVIANDWSRVHVIPGSSFLNGPPGLSLQPHWTASSAAGFGATLISGFDLDHDGELDIAVGCPADDVWGIPAAGRVYVLDTTASFHQLGRYESSVAGEHLATSMDSGHDFDGDGCVDFVFGAPDWSWYSGGQDGRAVVVSGAKLLTNTFPVELYVLNAFNTGVNANVRLGAGVSSCGDLNNDGVGDLILGTPSFSTTQPFGPNRGGTILVSGASGTRIGQTLGGAFEQLGDVIPGAVQDFDGDGFAEFVVAGSQADSPATDCGTLKCYRLWPLGASFYCTSKINSLGCSPSFYWDTFATPSASSTSPFVVTCTQLINQKVGLYFYSHRPDATPFQGGYMCVKPPTRRTPVQSSGGSTNGTSCTGFMDFDFNPWIQSGIDPTLVAGAEVFTQCWSRDPQSPSSTSLSNALRFVINP